MIHDPVPPDAWAAEGARSAPALEDVAAALVIGLDPEVTAIVAFALARTLRDGLPVSEIAQRAGEDPRIFPHPSGAGRE